MDITRTDRKEVMGAGCAIHTSSKLKTTRLIDVIFRMVHNKSTHQKMPCWRHLKVLKPRDKANARILQTLKRTGAIDHQLAGILGKFKLPPMFGMLCRIGSCLLGVF